VTYPRHLSGRQNVVQAETGEFQENTREAFLTVVEKLIAEILFEFDIASQERSCEFFGKLGLPMKGPQHGTPFDPVNRGALYCDGAAHPDGLADQATFTKKAAWAQDGQNCFASHWGYHSDLYLSVLNKVNGIGFVTLSKYFFVLGELRYGLPFRNCFEQVREIRICDGLGGPRLPCFDRRGFPAAGSDLHIL
jgi:hypothetical protein